MQQGLQKGLQKGIQKGLQKGITRGKKEGLMLGVSKERLNIARKMLRSGNNDKNILKITKIESSEFGKLKKQHNSRY